MAEFRNYDEAADDSLTLPVGGTPYTIAAPDAQLGLWCQRLTTAGLLIHQGKPPGRIPPLPALPADPDQTPIGADENGNIADGAEERLYRRVLGPVWDQMLADKRHWQSVKLVSQTAVMWIGLGLEMAERFWDSGGDPEAFAPNRKARRSTPTAGATTTKKPASTRVTPSRKTAGKR